MKCIKEISTNSITRVNDERAVTLIKKGTHVYVSKKLWKESIEVKMIDGPGTPLGDAVKISKERPDVATMFLDGMDKAFPPKPKQKIDVAIANKRGKK